MALQQKSESDTWKGFTFRWGITAVFHPLEYAKVLMQLGFEPITPTQSKTLFGKPALALPNVLQYVTFIKDRDGILGCYSGIGPRLCYNLVSSLAYQKTMLRLSDSGHDESECSREREDSLEGNICRVVKDMTARVTAIVISQPFHVITVRTMAQFIGNETKYNGVFNAISSVYEENGILGFFQGLVPRVLGEVLAITISSTLTYVFRSYLIEDKDVKVYLAPAMMFIASAVTYPFQVVATCMTVNRSSLAVSYPPYMPVYTSWTDCWSHLSRTNQLKRGNGIFFRYYTGPQVLLDGKVVMIDPITFSYEPNKPRYVGS